MSLDRPSIADDLRAFAATSDRLRAAGLLRSNSLVGDVGEWIAARHYGVPLAKTRTQGYDLVIADGRCVQVKTLKDGNDGRRSEAGARLGPVRHAAHDPPRARLHASRSDRGRLQRRKGGLRRRACPVVPRVRERSTGAPHRPKAAQHLTRVPPRRSPSPLSLSAPPAAIGIGAKQTRRAIRTNATTRLPLH